MSAFSVCRRLQSAVCTLHPVTKGLVQVSYSDRNRSRFSYEHDHYESYGFRTARVWALMGGRGPSARRALIAELLTRTVRCWRRDYEHRPITSNTIRGLVL
eukprot:scaffold56108_cov20-Prasinocladus_malaysianus.AAC.1